MTVAQEIRALRAALGENRETFARRWHKSGRTMENWELGRDVPDPFVLEAIRALAAKTRTAGRRTKRRPAAA